MTNNSMFNTYFKDKRKLSEYKNFIDNFKDSILNYLDINVNELSKMSIHKICIRLKDFEPMKLMLEDKLLSIAIPNYLYGTRFNVKLIFKGDRYGVNGCLTHTDDIILLEFYDNKNKITDIGEFISRLTVNSLLGNNIFYKIPHKGALYLDSYVPQWTVDIKQMKKITTWVKNHSKVQKLLQKNSSSLFMQKEQKVFFTKNEKMAC